MVVDDSTALAGFVALAAHDRDRHQQALTGLSDVRIVTGFAGKRIVCQPVGGGPEAALPALAHVAASVDDEVMVTRLGAGWVVIGNLTARVAV